MITTLLTLMTACQDPPGDPPTSEAPNDTAPVPGDTDPPDTDPPDEEVPQLTVVGDGVVPVVLAAEGETHAYAAAELADYLSQVTGQDVQVVDDVTGAELVLHVGPTQLVGEHLDLTGLRADGFVLRHLEVDDTDHLVLAGHLDRASQWAVERFLSDHVGVYWLSPDPDHGTHVPSASTITVDEGLDRTVEPTYAGRGNLSMYMFTSNPALLRGGPAGASQYGQHALQHIFDGDDFAAHPEWFAYFDGERQWWEYGNGWQICTANHETVQHAAQWCIDYFEDNPGELACSIGQNDSSGHCTDQLSTDLMASVDPAYSYSELWWLWVNEVAREVAGHQDGVYADRWIEALAYDWSSDPPRFALEPNVAITKTIVLDHEIAAAEAWLEEPAECRSVNLYSYPMCSSFLGFRHYPTAMADFLVWGADTLGAQAHTPECGPGDWTFDGPKYFTTQALQWDPHQDPAALMQTFCDASYGAAADDLCAFWAALEEVWEAREGTTTYGDEHTRWMFYQWVGWANSSYVPPNDELRTYTEDDVASLDAHMAAAVAAAEGESESVRYRVERMEEAWGYYRTFVLSRIRYHDGDHDLSIAAAYRYEEVLELAEAVAQLRADRESWRALMGAHPETNVRLASEHGQLGWLEGFTIFSAEQVLADDACDAVTAWLGDDAEAFWAGYGDDAPLYDFAQTQLHLLGVGETQLLADAGFESGGLGSWTTTGSVSATTSDAATGSWSLLLSGNEATASQDSAVQQLARYRLRLTGRYLGEPDDELVATEAYVRFYDATGAQITEGEPTRAMFASRSPDDGWTELTSTMTAPLGATRATVTVKKMHDAEMLIDDVELALILPGPEVTDGELRDTFDGSDVDWLTWYPAVGGSGSVAPRVEDGFLVYDDEDAYGINSLASFDELFDDSGEDAYRLQLHLELLEDGDPEAIVSFGIKTGTGPISINDSGLMFYAWFDQGDGTAAIRLYAYEDSVNTQVMTGVLPLSTPVEEIFYTLVFEPDTVTVYASDSGFSEDAGDLVFEATHGIGDITTNGSVAFKLDRGSSFRVDEVSLR